MALILSLIVWTQQHFLVPVLLVFLLVVVTTYWPGRRQSMEHDARIPFDADR
jgi:cbb3-type cytochrome oxidase subunit 3